MLICLGEDRSRFFGPPSSSAVSLAGIASSAPRIFGFVSTYVVHGHVVNVADLLNLLLFTSFAMQELPQSRKVPTSLSLSLSKSSEESLSSLYSDDAREKDLSLQGACCCVVGTLAVAEAFAEALLEGVSPTTTAVC